MRESHTAVNAAFAGGVVASFLRQYYADRIDGTAKSLSTYQRAFPGFEAEIAREFRKLELGESSIGEDEPSAPASGGSRSSRVGDAFGHYRIVEELGRGGQGCVFLADDLKLDRRVALKLLSATGVPAFGDSPIRSGERLLREAAAAARLVHPGICPIYEAGEVDGEAFIAMAHVPGQSLAEILSRAKVRRAPGRHDMPMLQHFGRPERRSVAAVTRFIEQLARALHVAHESGLVHRDVKPGNIMVTPKEEPVMLDFGLARDERTDHITMSGQMMGTPPYMAPEQIMGAREQVDRRADIYALATTLFECLTLRRPFEASTRGALLNDILATPAPDARSLNRGIPRDLRDVLAIALEKDPNHRYATAEHFADDLARIRRDEPIAIKRPGRAVRTVRWARRERVKAALIIVLAIGIPAVTMLAGFLIGNLGNIDRAKRAQRELIAERAAAEAFEKYGFGRTDPDVGIAFDRALAHAPKLEAIVGKILFELGAHGDAKARETFNTYRERLAGTAGEAMVQFNFARHHGSAAEMAMWSERWEDVPRTPLWLFFEAEQQRTRRRAGREVRRDPVALLEEAILSTPTPRPLYYFRLVIAATEARRTKVARRVADAMVRLWPEDSRAWFKRSFALQRSGDSDGAIVALERSLSIDPDFVNAHVNLTSALRDAGRLDDSLAQGRRGVIRYPNEANMHIAYGLSLVKAGRRDEAEPTLRRALELDPDHADASWFLGGIFEHRRENERALHLFERSLATVRIDHRRFRRAAKLALRMKRYEDAVRFQKHVVRLRPRDASAWHSLGCFMGLTKDNDGAQLAYRNALEIDPGRARTHVGLALQLQRAKKYTEAIAHMAKGHRLGKGSERWNIPSGKWLAKMVAHQEKTIRKRAAAFEADLR